MSNVMLLNDLYKQPIGLPELIDTYKIIHIYQHIMHLKNNLI
jgi:hypothetical protein